MGNPRIRKYAWEFPVRFTHWINFLCILTFIVTGLYIAGPFVHSVSPAAFTMAWMRYIHIIAGWAFFCSFLIRMYWAFAGNKYASWRVWLPYTPERFKDVTAAFKFYTFMTRKPPYAVGHTGLAGLTYFFIFALFAFQIVSGFALHSLSSQSALAHALGGWLTGIMDLQTIRVFHHLGMWLIIAFTFVHLYIGWWVDLAEKNGLMGSIFSGYKFVTGKEWE